MRGNDRPHNSWSPPDCHCHCIIPTHNSNDDHDGDILNDNDNEDDDMDDNSWSPPDCHCWLHNSNSTMPISQWHHDDGDCHRLQNANPTSYK